MTLRPAVGPVTPHLFRPDGLRTLRSDEDLTLPDILPGFLVLVRRLFE